MGVGIDIIVKECVDVGRPEIVAAWSRSAFVALVLKRGRGI